MNTKEAIDEKINLLLMLKSLYSNSNKPNYARIITDCITDIEEGKKYKEMWEDFHYRLAHVNIGSYRNPLDDRKMTDMDCINEIVRDVKQKYFPEPTKLCSDIELLEQIKNEFAKNEHSYYIERFMEVCIRLFKGKGENQIDTKDKTLAGSENSYEGAIYLLQHIQKKELKYESQGIFWAIDLLKRGEKYKQMWEETNKIWFDYKLNRYWLKDKSYQSIVSILEFLQQKYFPKEENNDV